MPRRVLFTVTARPALDIIAGQVDNLVREGWHVDVVVGEPVRSRMFARAELRVLPMARSAAPLSDWRALRRWHRLLTYRRPDIVVGATPKAALLSMCAARSVGIRHRLWWIWGLRSEMSNPLAQRIETSTARAATLSVAASESLADVVRRAGAPTRPVVLGHGAVAGVDVDHFHPRGRRADGAPTAIYVGRLARAKGIDALPEVWRRVNAAVPGARLLVVGSVDPLDPPQRALRELRELPGVEVLGFRHDIADLMRAADVLLLPSSREGMPGVVLEAAASGLPTVAWDATGTRDAVVNGQTGFLSPRGDIDGMAVRATRLLSDGELRRSLGASARDFVVARFDRHDVEGRFARLLSSLVALPPHLRHLDLTEPRATSGAPRG